MTAPTINPARRSPATLVGRDADLAAVAEALARPPGLVVVEGEAGVGKTRLVTEATALPDLAARRWLSEECRRIREPFPLAPLIDAVRHVGGDDLHEARLSPVAGSLRPLIPEIADALPPPLAPLDDRIAERHRVFRGLVDVFGSLGPTVLVLEDLHWADEQTVEFLGYLAAECPPQLSVVMTFRGDEVHPSVLAAIGRVRRVDLHLKPLDGTQTGRLAASILDTDHVSEEFAAHLCARASGVPLAIEELLAVLRARGTLTRTSEGWARRTIEELDVPAGIRDPVLERVSRLSAGARSVVEAAAVLQDPAPVSVLAATCNVDEPADVSAMEEALSSGLLSEHGPGQIGFRHVLAAEAVYEAMVGPRRTELHDRAATALRTLDPAPLGRLAHHLRHADRLDEWSHMAEAAADQATALGDDEQAASMLEDVFLHAPNAVADRARIAVKLSRAAIETMHPVHDLIFPLSTTLKEDLPAEQRGELALRLALMVEMDGGDQSLQRQLYKQAVTLLDHRPDLKAWATMGLVVARAPGVRRAERKDWVNRVLDLLPEVDDEAFQVMLLGKAAMALAEMGDPGWRQLTERISDQTAAAPRSRREVNAYYSVGLEASFLGHHQTAAGLLSNAMDGAVKYENRQLQVRISVARALLDYFRGTWSGLDAATAALQSDVAGYPSGLVDVQLVAGCLALAHGESDESEHLLIGLLHPLQVIGSYDELGVAVGMLSRRAVVEGPNDEDLHRVREFLATVDRQDLWVPMVRALPSVVHVLVSAGHPDEAQVLVARSVGEFHELDAALVPAAMRHARGFLETADRQWDKAAQSFLAAADLYEPLPCPYEAAQAREQAAVAMFEGGNAGGEEQLLAALATYRKLGAGWDDARCARVARSHGVRLPVPHRGGRKGYGNELSPREAEVARLMATGLSNKEIAAELFLSPRTVGEHLSRAMRKHGVRSRAALAARLMSRPGAEEGEG